MLYHGPVRVVENAKPGTAKLRVRIEPDKGYDSVVTELSVVLAE